MVVGSDEVAALIVRVADEVIVPRFDRLADGEVAEKSPGDYVTVADREAEEILGGWLRAADPGASVWGEEQIAAEPGLLAGIDAAERAWLVDPLDGTGNFVKGVPDFGVLVVELRRGVPIRSWIWQAMRRHLFFAEAGAGAYRDGVRLGAPAGPGHGSGLVGGVTPEFLGVAGPGLAPAVPFTGSCTADYPLIATGGRDYLIHNGKHAWDHYPGILLLGELGGRVAFMDSEPFAADSSNEHKIVAARTPEVWQQVASAGLNCRERRPT